MFKVEEIQKLLNDGRITSYEQTIRFLLDEIFRLQEALKEKSQEIDLIEKDIS